MNMSTNRSDLDNLTLLGEGTTPSKSLETFPNQAENRYYLVTLTTDEFTCRCPKTGQPDFANLRIQYVPDMKVVESKSLKLYLWSYRDEGVFHEHVVNTILEDMVDALDPHYCRVSGDFNIRGGIGISVQTEDIKTSEAKSAIRDSLV